MAGSHDERSVHVLRRRAERAIDEGRGRLVVEPLLEAILERAGEDDPAYAFAHRHLAELLLERDPWSAALHLRKMLTLNDKDDIAHSLMALSQALLGNYHAAAASYRRALRVCPRNLWYHHNLGHLLDVGLDDPEAALPHLEFALAEVDQMEHEIIASTAHCLARVGHLLEAEELAEMAADAAPDNRDHETLLRWVRLGAPEDQPVHALGAGVGFAKNLSRRVSSPDTESPQPPPDRVRALFEPLLAAASFSAAEIVCAQTLWRDYQSERGPRINNPAVFAAAVHYAIGMLCGPRITQAALAAQYGVGAGSISSRYSDIRNALGLVHRDPRYTTPARTRS